MEIKEQKVKQLRKNFEEIIQGLEELSGKGMHLHQVEQQLFKNLILLGKALLQYYITLVSQLVISRGVPIDSKGKRMKNTGSRIRNYRSVFGIVEISRRKYYSKEDKVIYPVDKVLGLPQGVYSYLLMDWLSYGATEMDFDQSVRLLSRILNQELQAMQSSRVTYKLSEGVEHFYELEDWSEKEQAECLSLSIDGKGIRIVAREMNRQAQSTITRLGKGKRKGLKKEATVCVSSSFRARKREAQEIIGALFGQQDSQSTTVKASSHKFHEDKHMRAFLSNKKKAIAYGIDNLIKRDPLGNKPIIILIDGEPVLRKQAVELLEAKGLGDRLEACILDFIHVMEKVWKVANAYKGEKAVDREDWVEQQAWLLLNSQTAHVIEQWEVIAGLKKYSKVQDKNIKDAINYLKKRKEMMDYKTFLQKGYPITTGAVESACGHFVKSRMERNGMHWSKEGAQKMLDIRAVKKNGDWESYIEHFIAQQQNQIYKSAA